MKLLLSQSGQIAPSPRLLQAQIGKWIWTRMEPVVDCFVEHVAHDAHVRLRLSQGPCSRPRPIQVGQSYRPEDLGEAAERVLVGPPRRSRLMRIVMAPPRR